MLPAHRVFASVLHPLAPLFFCALRTFLRGYGGHARSKVVRSDSITHAQRTLRHRLPRGAVVKLEDSQSAPYAAFEPDAPASSTLPSRNYDDNFYSQPQSRLPSMDAVTGGLDVPALAKGLNLLVSILCVACAIAFMSEEGSYLSVIIGLETAFFAAALACVELQLDPPLSILRSVVPFVTTLRGEAFVAVLGVLFLFAMGTFGVVMAIILLCTLALNGYVAFTNPESMQRDGGGDAGAQFAAAGYDVDDAAFSPAAQPSTADL